LNFSVHPQQPPRRSARDIVYAKLREQILNLELPPGTALSEQESALAFKVSRTPVRESFMRLAQEGLVEVLPQRGTFVSLIDTELVEEARFMREQLEAAVVRLACERFPKEALDALDANVREQRESMAQRDDRKLFELDETFHRILFEGCGKRNTWLAIQQMNLHLNRSRLLRLKTAHEWNHLCEQHERIARSVRERNAAEAERTMREHLRLGIADLAELKESLPHYFKSGE